MTAPRLREQCRPPSPPDRRPPRRGGRSSSQTASAAVRPAGFARLAGALLVLLGALALPATAEAQTETGICGRTQQVRDAIVGLIPSVSNCADVTATHLAGIDSDSPLLLPYADLTALKAGDFDGLTALTVLWLPANGLISLPAGVFDNNTALRTLHLDNNGLISLPAGVFNYLSRGGHIAQEDAPILRRAVWGDQG